MRLLLPLLLILPLAACSGGSADPAASVDEGHSALARGDYSSARSSFESAVAGLPDSDPRWLEARLGACQARAHDDPEGARDDFLVLAGSRDLSDKDYTLMASELESAGQTLVAIDVVDAGVKAFPDSERMMKVLDQLKKKATSADDPAALEKLKGLGYIGGDG